MAIEAVLFDLGKVIVDFDLRAMLEEFTPRCSRSPAEVEELMRSGDLLHRFESGQMSTGEYYVHVCEALGLKIEMPAFWRAIESIFARDLLVSEALLKALNQRYPLILVSNTNAIHANYIRENYPVFDYFRHKVLSYEVGSMKPDRRIFEKAIEVSGKQPRE